MNPYLECPKVTSEHFTIRLIEQSDSDTLFNCYNDEAAVKLMNDDNCDFGFFCSSREQMAQTVGYWLDFYKKKYFIRFAIVFNETGEAVGTVEGFVDTIGVLRIDLSSQYEKAEYLSEILLFAQKNFREYFGNEFLVTKAIDCAHERRTALKNNGWEYIGEYKGFSDYFKIKA